MRARTHLLLSLAGATSVANGIRPLVRSGLGTVPAWISGWIDSELPRSRIASHAGLLAIGARRGSLSSGTGRVAAVANVAAIAGLVHLHRQSERAAAVLEHALSDELGADYRQRIQRSPWCDVTDVPVRRRSIPLAATRPRQRYVVGAGRDVVYGEAGPRNTLDVWRRADLPHDAGAPVLVQIHGGGWVGGNKNSQAFPLLDHLTARGWVCVSATYRVGPRATWPDLIVDVMRAIAWTKQNIDHHGGDPGFVAVTGGSAGGHLSALAALAANDPVFQPGFESIDTTVQAAIPLYGVYDWLNRDGTNHDEFLPWLERMVVKQKVGDAHDVFEQASPRSRIHSGAPPFFVVHGENDSLVRVEQARVFSEELRRRSRSPVVFAALPCAQHAFDTFASPRSVHTAHAVERFLGVVCGQRQDDPIPRANPRPHEAS